MVLLLQKKKFQSVTRPQFIKDKNKGEKSTSFPLVIGGLVLPDVLLVNRCLYRETFSPPHGGGDGLIIAFLCGHRERKC